LGGATGADHGRKSLMSAPYDTNLYRAVVIENHDADTSHILLDVGFDLDIHLTVRYFGINAPELSTPAGKAALAWLNGVMPSGSKVGFRSHKATSNPTDKFGRYLGIFVLSDGTNVNDLLVSSGHAVPYFGGKR